MKNVDGFAGCFARGKCRETGTVTGAYVSAEQGIDTGDEPYAVLCEDHGSVLGVPTKDHARYFRAHPLEFCDHCRGGTEP